VSGTPAAPEVALSFDAREIALPGADFGNLPPGNISLDATLRGGRLDAALAADGITEEPVRLSMGLPVDFALEPVRFAISDDAPLRGSLDARLNLERLSRLIELDNQVLEGSLIADLALAGSIVKPEANGAVTLEQGKYQNGATGTLLDGIEARILASGQTIRLENLSATDGQRGRLGGRGELSLAQSRFLDFTAGLQLTELVLVRSDDLDLTLSGDLSVEGDPESGLASGSLTVNQAEYRLPSRFGPNVPTIAVKEVYDGEPLTDTEKVSEPSYYDLALAIGIDIPSRTFVRGRGLESEWRGSLRVEGTADEPKIVGNLEIRRGRFDFLDTRFTLSRGLIEFFGSSPPEPTLDIEARSQGTDVIAIIGLQGPASAPELKLESEPELPEDEVLSRLLFNSDSSNLTAAQTIRLAAAVQQLAGGGGRDLMGEVRAASGLDTLDVDATSTGGSVEAGRYLTEDIFLEVISGFGDQPSRVRVEKQISPQFSIETDVDQNSNSSFGINWRLDY
jgi:translocation and assembly module TamB